LFPDSSYFLNSLINLYIYTGRNDQALQLLSTAISKNANSAQLYYAKGSVYETGLKDYAQAEEAYKKAVELDPNSAANNFSMGRIYYNQGVSTLDKANSISEGSEASRRLRFRGGNEGERRLPVPLPLSRNFFFLTNRLPESIRLRWRT